MVLFLWFKAPTQSYGDFKVWLENMIIYRTLESVLPTKDSFFGVYYKIDTIRNSILFIKSDLPYESTP